jgi:hypothetical protein
LLGLCGLGGWLILNLALLERPLLLLDLGLLILIERLCESMKKLL